jgi:hypothetical protein
MIVIAALFACGTGGTGVARAETPIDFTKGTEFYSLRATYQNARGGESTYLASVTPSFGHYFLDNAAFEVQVPLYLAKDEEMSVGIGVNVLARYHFINWDRYSLYGDVLGGIFGTTDDFPTGGTSFNFTYGGGPGLSIRLREGLHLDGGLRFQHVSNGYIKGRDRNPIFNSFGGYVGFMWTR